MRVVLATQAATGHVYPLLPMAEALVGAGHDVQFLAGAELVPWLTRLGYAALPVGVSIAEGVARVQAMSPELTTSLPRPDAWRLDAALFADVLVRAALPGTLDTLDELRPDLVVAESTSLAAVLAAFELGVPVAVQSLWAAGHWHVPPAELEARLAGVWTDRHGGPPPGPLAHGALELDPAPPMLTQPPVGSAPRRLPVRPLPWGDPATPPPDLPPGFSSGRRPLALVTLGTVGWGGAEVLRTLVAGVASLPVDVLVTGQLASTGGLGDLPPSVHATPFLRQDLLFPQLDVVVHHAGSGTLLGAAAHAVPQVVVPFGADQFENADALTASGAGLALDVDELTSGAVAAAVEALLEDPGHRSAVAALAEQIAALPLPSERVADLEELAGRRTSA